MRILGLFAVLMLASGWNWEPLTHVHIELKDQHGTFIDDAEIAFRDIDGHVVGRAPRGYVTRLDPGSDAQEKVLEEHYRAFDRTDWGKDAVNVQITAPGCRTKTFVVDFKKERLGSPFFFIPLNPDGPPHDVYSFFRFGGFGDEIVLRCQRRHGKAVQ